MNDGTQSLAQVKDELLEKVDVDRKVDAVDQTRADPSTLITATATGLGDHIEKKFDQMAERLIKAAEARTEAMVDRMVEGVVGILRERSRHNAAVVDRIGSLERKLDEHISNASIHHTHGARRR